jgi:hypothetical protein
MMVMLEGGTAVLVTPSWPGTSQQDSFLQSALQGSPA